MISMRTDILEILPNPFSTSVKPFLSRLLLSHIPLPSHTERCECILSLCDLEVQVGLSNNAVGRGRLLLTILCPGTSTPQAISKYLLRPGGQIKESTDSNVKYSSEQDEIFIPA